MILRPYQQEAVDTAWEKLAVSDNALIVMSCGLGKTECAFGLFKRAVQAKPDIRITFVVNRLPLLQQTFERLSAVFPPHWCGLYFGKKKEVGKAITVGTIQSLARSKLPPSNLLLFDECHRVSTDQDSLYAKFIASEKEKNKKLKIVGLTATPYRSTGFIYGEEDSYFDRPCYEKGLKWAIENNFLVTPRTKHVNEQFDTTDLRIIAGDFDQGQLEEMATEDKIRAQVEDALPRLKGRSKVVWATTGVNHADILCAVLKEHGEDAVSYHYKTEDKEEKMRHFKERGRHLSFVNIVSEGWDFPAADALCFCRPTRSPVLYVQTAGRVLRLHESKSEALILDYGSVIKNCGPLDNPNIPKKGERNKIADKMKFCPKCYEYMEKTQDTCPCCGFKEPPPPEKKEADRTKKLHTTHQRAPILSKEKAIKQETIEIADVTTKPHVTRNGANSIVVTYHPKNIFRNPVKVYAVFGDAWLNRKASEKLAKVGIYANGYNEAIEKKPTKKVKSIKVTWGNFPEVTEHIYDQ